jgi:hypothetical protein
VSISLRKVPSLLWCARCWTAVSRIFCGVPSVDTHLEVTSWKFRLSGHHTLWNVQIHSWCSLICSIFNLYLLVSIDYGFHFEDNVINLDSPRNLSLATLDHPFLNLLSHPHTHMLLNNTDHTEVTHLHLCRSQESCQLLFGALSSGHSCMWLNSCSCTLIYIHII